MMGHGIGGRVNGGIKAMKAWIPLPEPYRV